MNKQEIIISSTAMASSGCSLKFQRVVLQGYKPKLMPVAMLYGIACHKYIQVAYETNGRFDLAQTAALKMYEDIPHIDDPKKKYLSDRRHLLTTCMNLWMNYIQDEKEFEVIYLEETKHAIEIQFKIKIYEDDFIIVYLAGTIDRVGKFRSGAFAIGDWKFTSAWNAQSYFEQYELARGLRTYALAAYLTHQSDPTSILGRIGGTKMGTFIDATFLNENANQNVTTRSKLFSYSEKELLELLDEYREFCAELSVKMQVNKFTREGILNGFCQNQYEKKCQFWHICNQHFNPNQAIIQLGLDRDFQVVKFNPLNYNEINGH